MKPLNSKKFHQKKCPEDTRTLLSNYVSSEPCSMFNHHYLSLKLSTYLSGFVDSHLSQGRDFVDPDVTWVGCSFVVPTRNLWLLKLGRLKLMRAISCCSPFTDRTLIWERPPSASIRMLSTAYRGGVY
jgi:hypothetical protein